MKNTIISSLKTISRVIPLKIYPRLLYRDIIDFFWHVVSDSPMPHVHNLYPVVPTQDFETALKYLQENFTIISYQQLHAHVFEGAQLPPKALHISFDDGYAECFNIVRPILLKFDIPCTFFLTTDLIDNKILFYRNKQSLCIDILNEPDLNFQASIANLQPLVSNKLPATLDGFISWFGELRLSDESLIDEICLVLGLNWQKFLVDKKPYLTTNQIQQMQADGFTIGAHTCSHRKLIDLPPDEINIEIKESCRIIKEITGQEIVPFSFPHSAAGLDRDHLAEIRSQNPMTGLLFDTKGLRLDATFIHNRIWAERPLPNISADLGEGKQINKHLHQAYQEAWVEEVMAKLRRLR